MPTFPPLDFYLLTTTRIHLLCTDVLRHCIILFYTPLHKIHFCRKFAFYPSVHRYLVFIFCICVLILNIFGELKIYILILKTHTYIYTHIHTCMCVYVCSVYVCSIYVHMYSYIFKLHFEVHGYFIPCLMPYVLPSVYFTS